MCLGLHLEGVSDGVRHDMRSCSTLEGLWGLLVDAVAGVDSVASLALLVEAIEAQVGLPKERPAWVQALKKRTLGSAGLPAAEGRPAPPLRPLDLAASPSTPAGPPGLQPPADWQPPKDVSVQIYGHRGLDHGIVCRALRDRLGTDMGLPAEAMRQGSHVLGQLSRAHWLRVAGGAG